jgi:hypothetical protein
MIAINFVYDVGRAACEARGAMWDLGYHDSVCSGTEENHGKA